jgi:hypothetical protein
MQTPPNSAVGIGKIFENRDNTPKKFMNLKNSRLILIGSLSNANLMSLQIIGFGDHWVDGQDVRHPLGPLYWSQKLRREISRAVSQRDFPALASLVCLSVRLRDRLHEARFSSFSFLSLITGITLICPFDDSLRPIFRGLLAEIPKSRRSAECCAALTGACGPADRAAAVRERIEIFADPPNIADLADLRIAQDIYREPARFPEAQLRILRVDPCADFRVCELIDDFAPSDWRMLVNRVDRLRDAESWQCLAELLHRGMATEALDALRRYVGSYWPRFHADDVGPTARVFRDEVMRALRLEAA